MTDTTTTSTGSDNFIFFEGAVSAKAARPRITVRRGGLMISTAPAAAMLGEKVEAVQLAFNRETGAVAIRAASAGAAGAYHLRHQMKGNGWQITGKRFFGLDVAPSRRESTLGRVEPETCSMSNRSAVSNGGGDQTESQLCLAPAQAGDRFSLYFPLAGS